MMKTASAPARGGNQFAADTMQTPPLLLTVEQACELLNTNRRKLYDLFASGALRSVHLGRSRRIKRTDIEAFVASIAYDATPGDHDDDDSPACA